MPAPSNDPTHIVLRDVLTVEDLAHHLRRSESAVRTLLRLGVLPGRKIGRRWIVERGALIRALTAAPGSGRLHALPGGRDPRSE